jgi:hypothetical protein
MVHLKLYPFEYVHLFIPILPVALGTQVRGLFLNNRHVGCILSSSVASDHGEVKLQQNLRRCHMDVVLLWHTLMKIMTLVGSSTTALQCAPHIFDIFKLVVNLYWS